MLFQLKIQSSKNNLNKLLENQDPKLDDGLDKKSLFEGEIEGYEYCLYA